MFLKLIFSVIAVLQGHIYLSEIGKWMWGNKDLM